MAPRPDVLLQNVLKNASDGKEPKIFEFCTVDDDCRRNSNALEQKSSRNAWPEKTELIK